MSRRKMLPTPPKYSPLHLVWFIWSCLPPPQNLRWPPRDPEPGGPAGNPIRQRHPSCCFVEDFFQKGGLCVCWRKSINFTVMFCICSSWIRVLPPNTQTEGRAHPWSLCEPLWILGVFCFPRKRLFEHIGLNNVVYFTFQFNKCFLQFLTVFFEISSATRVVLVFFLPFKSAHEGSPWIIGGSFFESLRRELYEATGRHFYACFTADFLLLRQGFLFGRKFWDSAGRF